MNKVTSLPLCVCIRGKQTEEKFRRDGKTQQQQQQQKVSKHKIQKSQTTNKKKERYINYGVVVMSSNLALCVCGRGGGGVVTQPVERGNPGCSRPLPTGWVGVSIM